MQDTDELKLRTEVINGCTHINSATVHEQRNDNHHLNKQKTAVDYNTLLHKNFKHASLLNAHIQFY